MSTVKGDKQKACESSKTSKRLLNAMWGTTNSPQQLMLTLTQTMTSYALHSVCTYINSPSAPLLPSLSHSSQCLLPLEALSLTLPPPMHVPLTGL